MDVIRYQVYAAFPQESISMQVPQRRAQVFSMPHIPRPRLKATQNVLDAVYEAAHAGLRGDTLALAAGLLPAEYRELSVRDDLVDLAIAKGRADSEMEAASIINKAVKAGDTGMALEKRKHKHEWAATSRMDVSVSQEVSILAALEAAELRVLEYKECP